MDSPKLIVKNIMENGHLGLDLFVNEEKLPVSRIQYSFDTLEPDIVELSHPDAIDLLSRVQLANIASQLDYLILYPKYEWFDGIVRVHLLLTDRKVESRANRLGHNILEPHISLEFSFNYSDWSQPWTIREFAECIREVVSGIDALVYGTLQFSFIPVYAGSTQDPANRFVLALHIRDMGTDLKSELAYGIALAKSAYDEAKAIMADWIERDTLVTLFEFPESIQTACEQYLLYFMQFLRDLGLDANTSIRHEAQSVLFSVTPHEGAEALDRIREALEIYLSFPGSQNFTAEAAAVQDIAVRQLEANVFHLRGQLALAAATIQAKDAAIEALQLSNFQYRQLLSSPEAAKLLVLGGQEKDTEPIVEGVVELTPYEGKGVTIHLPEILRRLKRIFTERSILK